MPVILGRLPDGGMEFVMNEPQQVMALLDEDELFGKFVRREPS
jgi:hypothetical protein